MRIISSKTKLIYEYTPKRNGENYDICPECSKDRKHKSKKSFAWNEREKKGFCHNDQCNASFFEYKPEKEKKIYEAPVWKNITSLTDEHLKYIESRMISQKTLRLMKVYSDSVWMPAISANASSICFPFFLDDRLVNIKSRTKDKHFALSKNAELIFYNINALKDAKSIIITEGEFDCLSYIEVGFNNCISVPNGASARNIEYLDNYYDLFDKVEKIYLATDNDIAGIELREELIRRFGAERCLLVNFLDCKDANEMLTKKGGIALQDTIKNAIEIPVEGIIEANSIYDDAYQLYTKGMQRGLVINQQEFDDYITWETNRLAVVTGIPGHGKSEFVDHICIKLNMLYGYKMAYFSPENYPIHYHIAKLMPKIVGKQYSQSYISTTDFDKAYDHINDNIFFIYPEEDITLDNILTKAKHLIRKKGIKMLIIDPYNKIEHQRDRNESETEYISRFLDKLSMFARKNGILIFLIAHPRKMERTNKEYLMPTLYDINGSANFYNKCDYGIIVYRDFNEVKTIVNIQKVKFKHLGEGGTVEFMYNYKNGRYESGISKNDVNSWDYSNYLDRNMAIEPDYFKSLNKTPIDEVPF